MLKRVSIQNFKSLKDVTLDLQKVNLLIGPNNSGKTNFLKALELIREGENQPNYNPNEIAFGKRLSKEISVNLLWPSDREEFDWRIFKLYYDLNTLTSATGYFKNDLPDEIITGRVSIPDFQRYQYSSLKIYKLDPNKLAQPGPVGIGEEIVSADGSNLVGFLDLMLGKYRKSVFNRTENDLHTCIPEFDEINLDDAPATEELKKQYGDKSFKRLGLSNSKQGITYWADELSEGTLYFLALLCIINQPNPPKLLLLEEPEKGIHPRRLFEVMQFILTLVEEKDVQVIMTTHSPAIVDMFKDMPESVFIFDKDEEGATHVKNLLHDVIEPETERSKELGIEPPHYTDSLGDAWTVGFLGGVPK
ncbi:AAA family ATPase [Rudanella lutea]|uniref:AAA family ATPase n=1 Tax=Rudanella lutea TaxID=451374 RepID=UPI0003674773|nr:AAA family ATPase [Rudanella lutea]